MYDPARDSWKEEGDAPSENTEKVIDPINSKQDAQKSIGSLSSSSPGWETDPDQNEKKSLKERIIKNPKESSNFCDNSSDVSELDPSTKDSVVSDVQPLITKKLYKNQDVPDENIQKLDTGKRKVSDAEIAQPPRKFKRPTSRGFPKDRDVQAHLNKGRMGQGLLNIGEGSSRPNERSIVRDHYNKLPDQGQERRKQSPIIKLRSFNNWIKSMLISKYAQKYDTILDIGCGKGGDLWKWSRSRIEGFIGIDIAEVSIHQARERYNSAQRVNFWAKFYVGDVFEKPIEEIVDIDLSRVSIISCQFCLHYSFENETRIRTLLSNISRILPIGHYFIGTIPNSEVIIKHIRKLGPNERKWGNTIYSVEFEKDPPRNGHFTPPFGHKYTFFLEDAVGNVPEYVVPFESFRALCEEYNLTLEYRKPFLKLFEEHSKDNYSMELAKRMKVIKEDGTPGIEGDEREACGFYLAFAFKRVR